MSLLRFISIAAIGLVVLIWPQVAAQSVNLDVELDKAARSFRVLTYQYFRNDRATYDRRIRGSRALIDRWKARGAAPQEALDLIDWFQNATIATQQGKGLADLPFRVSNASTDALDVHLEAVPAIEGARARNPRRSRSKTRENLPPRPPTADLAAAGTELPLAPSPPRKKAIRLPTQPPRVATRIEIKQPAPVASTTVESSAVEASAVESSAVELLTPAPIAMVEPRPTSPAEPAPAMEQETIAVTTEVPAKINITQLAQRLAEHNRSIRVIEDELRLNDSWTVERMERKLDALDDLWIRYDVWNLYVNALDAKAKRRLGGMARFDKCLELIKQRVFEMQIANESQPLTQANLERSRRLHAIDERVRRWRTP